MDKRALRWELTDPITNKKFRRGNFAEVWCLWVYHFWARHKTIMVFRSLESRMAAIVVSWQLRVQALRHKGLTSLFKLCPTPFTWPC